MQAMAMFFCFSGIRHRGHVQALLASTVRIREERDQTKLSARSSTLPLPINEGGDNGQRVHRVLL